MKLAAAVGRWRIPNTRKGRRPMSVTTLLRKEQEGSLFKASAVRGSLVAPTVPPKTEAVLASKKGNVPDMHNDPGSQPRSALLPTATLTIKEGHCSTYVSARALGLFSELEKLAAAVPVTRVEAEHTLQKLRALDKNAPTAGELGRGAIVGAAAGPVAAAVSKTISGGWKKGFSSNIRDVAGQAASGAIFGGGVPFARHNVEHNSAEKKLRGYLDQSRGGKLKSTIKRELGKEAGILDTIKRVALTEIPNTKPWLINNASRASQHAKTTGKAAIPRLKPPPSSRRPAPSSRRTANGAYDVSALAAKMGV